MLASIRAFLWRILHLKRRTKAEATLDSELEFHLQMEMEQNLRQGMSREEARRQALIALGGLEQSKEAAGKHAQSDGQLSSGGTSVTAGA